jgi:hypothetical protein
VTVNLAPISFADHHGDFVAKARGIGEFFLVAFSSKSLRFSFHLPPPIVATKKPCGAQTAHRKVQRQLRQAPVLEAKHQLLT